MRLNLIAATVLIAAASTSAFAKDADITREVPVYPQERQDVVAAEALLERVKVAANEVCRREFDTRKEIEHCMEVTIARAVKKADIATLTAQYEQAERADAVASLR